MRQAFAAFALAACQSTAASPARTVSPPVQATQLSPTITPSDAKTTPRIVHAAEGAAVEILEGAPHIVRAVDVGGGVSLEVLDWGGAGPPIVLLSGLGNSAHIFDDLASAFVDRWHVLGVSRRGFGASSVPESGYDVPRLGADIVCVLDALQIRRAIFVGHSIAGEELTWLGTEHPDRVLGLVYLDAAYDRVALRQHRPPPTPEPPPTAADLASPTGYAAHMARGMGMPIPLDEVVADFNFDSDGHFLGVSTNPNVIKQLADAVRVPDYTQLRAPTLALYALADHWTADYAAYTAGERERFTRALPSARVEAVPHSKHYLFLTNRVEVVHQLRRFFTELELPVSNVRSE